MSIATTGARGLLALAVLIAPAILSPSFATVAEVSNARFDPEGDLAWDEAGGAVAYHVYRGALDGLPDNGECLLGSIPATSTDLPDDPDPGEGHFYLVTGFDQSGEGSPGDDSEAMPRSVVTPCKPARRIFGLTPIGAAADGVHEGTEPRRNADARIWSSNRETTGVYLHSGEFFLATVDSRIPGRGIDWTLERKYRSQITYDGPLGHGWDFNLNARLVGLAGGDVAYHDGSGRRDVFNPNPMMASPFFLTTFDGMGNGPPRGLYAVLKKNGGGTLTLRLPDGTFHHFHGLDGGNIEGVLESMEDRNGNTVRLLYDHQGLLTQVVDTLGRVIDLTYDADGRIESVTDYAGRGWVYSYDVAGNLIEARSPVVSPAPSGHPGYPAGKSTSYLYDAAHNLTGVVAPSQGPGGNPRVQNVYNAQDRVESQEISGTNGTTIPSGGTINYGYEELNSGLPGDLVTARRRATVVDRNGNVSVHTHNFYGNVLVRVEETNRGVRPSEVDYTTTYFYNEDGEITEVTHPEGNRTQYTYDVAVPQEDRYREGNVIELRRIADPARGGDGHGSSIADFTYLGIYEPVFNRLARVTDPRGLVTTHAYDYQEGDPAVNGVNVYLAEWGISATGLTTGLGDRNGDGDVSRTGGNRVRIDEPTVTIDPTSNRFAVDGPTQEIVTQQWWNDAGQLTRIIDAEQNAHTYDYHPENDPDGDGTPTPDPPGGSLTTDPAGYLRERHLDLSGVDIVQGYAYDAVGNLTAFTDGRAIRTESSYNELNQMEEVRRAADTGTTGLTAEDFKTRYEYDFNDNLSRVLEEDRGETRGIGPWIETTHEYDMLDDRTQTAREATPTTTLVTRYRFDPNQNRVLEILPEGNAGSTVYDERDLVFQRTWGATSPPPLAWLAGGDPTDYDVAGGTPSDEEIDYDGNRNPVTTRDGRGNPSDRIYDGFDRLVETVDQLGNTTTLTYDPDDNVTRHLKRGPLNGPAPADRTGATNIDLEDVEYGYDELNRLIAEDRVLFVPGSPGDTRVTEGTLALGDGKVNRRYEYDALSRTTHVVEDTEATTRYEYDGVSRLTTRTQPDGASTIQHLYDDAGNLVETIESERSSSSPDVQHFVTTYEYDALNRRTLKADNIGRAWRWSYDSLDKMTALTDARGPIQSSTVQRVGQPIAVPINEPGNLTEYIYDGADRRTAVIHTLTDTGEGGGVVTGTIELTTTWDDNSLVGSRRDGRSNTTAFSYDNLNRLTTIIADDDTVTTSNYDDNDNLSIRTDANGTVVTYTYDDADRKTRASVTNQASHVGGTTIQVFEWDGLDRLTRATDDNGGTSTTVEIEFAYDSLGRLVEERQKINPLQGNTPVGPDYHWTAADLLNRLDYPDGRTVSYGYDAADRLQTITDPAPGGGSVSDIDYFGMMRIHTTTYGNGVTTQLLPDGYDGVRRIVKLKHRNASILAGFQYAYDAAGNLLHERRDHDPSPPSLQGEVCEYDSLDRITELEEGPVDATGTISGNLQDRQTWLYDEMSNWAEITRRDFTMLPAVDRTYGATPNNLNEYDEEQSGNDRIDNGFLDDFRDDKDTPAADGLNHGHDKNGNLTQIDDGMIEQQFTYDAFDRLVSIDRNGTNIATYTYDALDRRVTRDVTNRGVLNESRRYLYGSRLAQRSTRRTSLVTDVLDGMLVDRSGGETAFPRLRRVGFATDVLDGILVDRSGTQSIMPSSPAVVEERQGASTVRQAIGASLTGKIVQPLLSGALWQVRPGASPSTHYLFHDPRGNTVAVATPTAPATIAERVTYDAYGTPTFEDAANDKLCNDVMPAKCSMIGGPFIARSTVGNPDLFRGMRYDPETGVRTRFGHTDYGGLYFSGWSPYNPDEGRGVVRQMTASQVAIDLRVEFGEYLPGWIAAAIACCELICSTEEFVGFEASGGPDNRLVAVYESVLDESCYEECMSDDEQCVFIDTPSGTVAKPPVGPGGGNSNRTGGGSGDSGDSNSSFGEGKNP